MNKITLTYTGRAWTGGAKFVGPPTSVDATRVRPSRASARYVETGRGARGASSVALLCRDHCEGKGKEGKQVHTSACKT